MSVAGLSTDSGRRVLDMGRQAAMGTYFEDRTHPPQKAGWVRPAEVCGGKLCWGLVYPCSPTGLVV